MIYGTPTIVTNGLVLNLDAASPKAAPTRNLFTYTTDLTNAAWTKTRCSITASAIIAPDGTNTAFAFNMSTGSNNLKRLTAPTVTSAVSGGLYTFSLFVKQNNFSGSGNDSAGIQLGNYNSSQTAGVEPTFNALSNFQTTGSFVLGPASSGSNVDRGTIDVGNGWYRIYATCNWASSVAAFSTFIDIDNGILTGSQYEGTGIYAWGPQFEAGYLSPYQPVTGTTKPWPSIGSTITGSMVNNPTWISSNGGSVVFDGVNDYLDLGTNSSIQTPTVFSIGMWFNAEDTISEQILWGNVSGVASGYAISLYNSKLTFQGYVTNQIFGQGLALQNSTWYHMTFIYNNGAASFYLNGVLYASTPANTTFTTPTNPTQIGRPVGSTYGSFKGKIAQTQYYNRVLSQQEITQNYNALKSRYGLS